jgi:hypothetical protein
MQMTSPRFQENMRLFCCALIAFNMMVVAIPNKLPCVNCPADRQCWGNYNINANYYENTPDTGRTEEVYPLQPLFHFC